MLGVTLIYTGEDCGELFKEHGLKFQLIYWPMKCIAVFYWFNDLAYEQKPLKNAAEKLLKEIQMK